MQKLYAQQRMQRKLHRRNIKPYSGFQLLILIPLLITSGVILVSFCIQYIIAPSLDFINLHLIPAFSRIQSQLLTAPFLFVVLNLIILVIFALPRSPQPAPRARFVQPQSNLETSNSLSSNHSSISDDSLKFAAPSLSPSPPLLSSQSLASQIDEEYLKFTAPCPSPSLESINSSVSQFNDEYEILATDVASCEAESRINQNGANGMVPIMQLASHSSSIDKDIVDDEAEKFNEKDSVNTTATLESADVEITRKEEDDDELRTQQTHTEQRKFDTDRDIQIPIEELHPSSSAQGIVNSSYTNHDQIANDIKGIPRDSLDVHESEESSTSTYSFEVIGTTVNTLITDRPLPSSRLSKVKTKMRSNSPLRPMSRLSAYSVNELRSSSPVRISKPTAIKKGETLDAIWMEICENKKRQTSSTLRRHHNIPHYGSNRMNSMERNAIDAAIRINRPSSPLSPVRSIASRISANADEYRDRPVLTRKRTSSIPLEELNAKVESFISRFREEIRIQREQSLLNMQMATSTKPAE